ncbi:MAG TPA: extracellular solute-binding protein [Terriglobia bacterium]|nr:extracellular solute-binding protein [Terriglobia bacterium]
MVLLRGTTWNHTRGYAPLVETAERFQIAHPEVEIQWEKRPLQDLADFPIEKLAQTHDMVIIDHPSVGACASSRCMLPLDELLPGEALSTLAKQSVGQSHTSYNYSGHQWALAIDAASHVSAYRDDLLQDLGVPAPQTWEEVLALGKQLHQSGQAAMAVPLIPVDSMMCFYTLCAGSGEDPFSYSEQTVVSRETGLRALDMLKQVLAISHPQSLTWNPINALDRMSSTSEVAYCPWLFGYSNYSRPGYAAFRCKFANIPTLKGGLPKGAILGGTGLAVSSKCAHPEIAAAYGLYMAGSECQRSTYFESGGQPGNIEAWRDAAVNQAADNFFLGTLDTLTNAYLRPRYAGYIHFQTQAGLIVHEFLKNGGSPASVLEALDRLYLATRNSNRLAEGRVK